MVTLYPRAFNKRPSDAAVIPFPSPDTTPPVTNTYFTAIVSSSCVYFISQNGVFILLHSL
jgi:hypothetical protein